MRSKRAIKPITLCLLLALVVSCAGQRNPMRKIIKHCPVHYKLSDFSNTTAHYSKLLNETSQYIAYKKFDRLGYTLVALTETEGQYTLPVSILSVPDTTQSKTIDAKLGQQIFEQAMKLNALENYKGESHFHPRCVFVGGKAR